MHETVEIAKPTRIFIGRPAEPIPPERIARLAAELERTPAIEAAYMPQVFGLPGQASSAQVLFLQVRAGSDRDAIARAVGEAIAACGLGPRDVLQLPAGDPLLASAAKTDCVVMAPRAKKPRWRFW